MISIETKLRRNMRGKLIIIEGPDDVGKTSLATSVIDILKNADVPVMYHSFPGRDERTLGGLVYDIHHNPKKYVSAIDPACTQILHVAAHIDAIVRVIKPALEAGSHVVLDRFWWSTYVYGMEYGIAEELLLNIIRAEQVMLGRNPDLAVLVERKNDHSRTDSLATRYVNLMISELPKYPCIIHNNEYEFRLSVMDLLTQLCAVIGVIQIPAVDELTLPEV